MLKYNIDQLHNDELTAKLSNGYIDNNYTTRMLFKALQESDFNQDLNVYIVVKYNSQKVDILNRLTSIAKYLEYDYAVIDNNTLFINGNNYISISSRDMKQVRLNKHSNNIVFYDNSLGFKHQI